MIKTGCCGFATAHEEYFNTFSLVEIQKTFYQLPQVSTAKRWREEEAPEGFEFTLKAWQMITHESNSPTYRRMSRELSETEKEQVGSFRWNDVTRQAWDKILDIAEILKADKIIFQCPSSFDPTDENKERIREFFGSINRHDMTCIWEPRGEWEQNEIQTLCHDLDLVHCVDPFKRECVTDGLRYYRLHGVDGYYHEYTDGELQELEDMCPAAQDNYCLFNNVSMFDDARRFAGRR